jgi:uncharacterized membrane protein
MWILRTLMLLALIVWIGGIIFFAFVLAPTVFAVLPLRELAGNVVNPTLYRLHWMGLTSGVVFLLCSLLHNRLKHAQFRAFACEHVLVVLMLGLTAFSQFAITPRMSELRKAMVIVDDVPHGDPRRVEFNRLHVWSTRCEVTVFFMGLVVVGFTARRYK